MARKRRKLVVKNRSPLCSFEGCERLRAAHKLCAPHYRQKLKGIPLTPVKPMVYVPCSFEGCDIPKRARGFCEAHYRQWTRKETLRPLRAYAQKTPRLVCRIHRCMKKANKRGYYCDMHDHGPRICIAPGCNIPWKTRGFCASHYSQVFTQKKKEPAPLKAHWFLPKPVSRWYKTPNPGVYGLIGAPFKTHAQNPKAWLACQLTDSEAAYISGFNVKKVRKMKRGAR